MKIFNVALRVSITQIAELPDNPPTEAPKPFNDNPLTKAEALIERAERFMTAPPRPLPGMFYASGDGDGASYTQNVRIQAETYEDLQSILKMFADTVKAINKAPDSLLRDAVPTFPSMG